MKILHMRTWLAAIVLLLTLTTVLVACTNNTPATETQAETEPAPETVPVGNDESSESGESAGETAADTGSAGSESETPAESKPAGPNETPPPLVVELETRPVGDATGQTLDLSVTNMGYDIYQFPEGGYGYRYGCTYLYNEDGSVDAYFAAVGKVSEKEGINEWDWISYRHSPDGGSTWESERIVLTPTQGAMDAFSVCDPGVVKFGGYYYLAYTSTLNPDGMCNNIFVARSENPDGPFDKWNGAGWGGYNPQPILRYDETYKRFGVGEPSMVVVDDVLYIYYTCDNDGTPGYAGNYCMVATADATNENWPATLQQRGVAYEKVDNTDSLDVKYIEEWDLFVAIAAGDRMTPSSWLGFYVSADGLRFEREDIVREGTYVGLHNVGLSSRPDGHIKLTEDFGKLRVIYAYGERNANNENEQNIWGKWNTRVQPVAIRLSDTENDMAREKTKACLSGTTDRDDMSGDRPIKMVRPEKDVYVYTTAATSFRINLYQLDFYSTKSSVTRDMTFVVHDESVVTISGQVATVKGVGTTAVDVTYEGCSFRFYVTITDTANSNSGSSDVLVDMVPVKDTYTIYIGEKAVYRPQIRVGLYYQDGSYTESYVDVDSPAIEFSGFDEDIIDLKSQGVVMAKAVGRTTVTVTCGGKTCTVTVIVSANPEDAYYYGLPEREIIYPDNLDFTTAGDEIVLTGKQNVNCGYDETEGALRLEATSHDPQICIEFDSASEYMASNYTTLTIVYKAEVESAINMQIFYCLDDITSGKEEYSACYKINVTGKNYATAGGAYHEYTSARDGDYYVLTIQLSDIPYWDGQLNSIRLDFINNATAGDVMYIQSIQLS